MSTTTSRPDSTTTIQPTITASPPSAEESAVQAKRQAAALKNLLAPVSGLLNTGVTIQIIASAAAFGPYIGLGLLAHALLAEPVDSQGAWIAIVVILSTASLRAVLNFLALTLTHIADVKLVGVLRGRMISAISRAPLSWFTARSSGHIRKALDNDLKDMHYLVAHARVEMMGAAVTPLIGAVIAFVIDWRLGLLSVATFPLYIAVFAVMSKGQTQRMHEMDQKMNRISVTLTELVDGVSVIKIFGATGKAHQQYRDATAGFRDFFESMVRSQTQVASFAQLLATAPLILLIMIGGGWFLIDSGSVTVVDVMVATLVAMVIPTSIMTAAGGSFAQKQAAQAAYRVQEILDTAPLAASSGTAQPEGACITFDNVTYSYTPGVPVIKGVSFQAEQGQVTALVGRSGSGKSTVASLVPRFADPDSGVVRIGGADVREIDEKTLYSYVGFVLQTVQLLNISVADNIRLGSPTATAAEIERVARAAHIHDVISALPRGYDSVIGDDAQLSGGERQRVSIARALMTSPPIIVLDEATAFADPDSEDAIQRALSTLLVGRTVLVIAHRLDVIRGADNIVVLDGGVVVEQGTHTDLVAAKGHYSSMWDAFSGSNITDNTPVKED